MIQVENIQKATFYDVMPKKNDAGTQKKDKNGRSGWVVLLAVKLDSDGLLTAAQPVTVWGEKPQFKRGEQVFVRGLQVGAYVQRDGNPALYFWASNVQSASDIEEMLGDS